MPRFEVIVDAYLHSEADRHAYFRVEAFQPLVNDLLRSGLRQAIEADARVSDPRTYRGPEGLVFSEFVVSAGSAGEAEEIGCDVFRAALLTTNERRQWTIAAGARFPMTEAELARCRVIVTLRPDLHVGFLWPTRQALIRRLECFEGTPLERARLAAVSALPPTVPVHEMFKAVRPSLEFPARISLTPTHEIALLLALEDWSRDLDADEAMPQGLVELQKALTDLHGGEWRKASE